MNQEKVDSYDQKKFKKNVRKKNILYLVSEGISQIHEKKNRELWSLFYIPPPPDPVDFLLRPVLTNILRNTSKNRYSNITLVSALVSAPSRFPPCPRFDASPCLAQVIIILLCAS